MTLERGKLYRCGKGWRRINIDVKALFVSDGDDHETLLVVDKENAAFVYLGTVTLHFSWEYCSVDYHKVICGDIVGLILARIPLVLFGLDSEKE